MRTGQPIRPVVIAHRGASGYLPEHTFPAKAMAYEMGADYLEQDVVATRDDELVVLHDIHLDRVTNVADIYPRRCRPNGRFYVRDFTLEEISSLSVHERTNEDGSLVYTGRYQEDGERFQVHTFREELAYIGALQVSGERSVGVYPEIKSPAWHQREGVDITVLFLDVLREFGYESHSDPVYVQCFDDAELIRIRESLGCELKLIQLIGENVWGEAETDYDDLRSAEGLARLAKTVDGVGPWLKQLYGVDEQGQIVDSGFVSTAHRSGLAVHPYTFRQDDYPADFTSFGELLDFAISELSVDGLFTDFPDVVLDAISMRSPL